jgi:outer membrane protein OmpA-like peptidoglycan-associated protein
MSADHLQSLKLIRGVLTQRGHRQSQGNLWRLAAGVMPGVLLLAGLWPAVAYPQGFGDRLRGTVERAAESEVQRRADQETRRVTRCALGDERCIREARQAGHEVEVVEAGGVTSPAVTGAAASGTDHPLIVPYTGSRLRQRQADAFNEYQRIVGHDKQARQVRTERLEGRLTRLRYDNPGGRSSLEVLRNYRDALTGRGLAVDYECSGRDDCGTIRNPGWNTLNGMNVGAGGDVRYFTGRMAWAEGQAFVSVAVTPALTYVHVLETAAMQTGMVSVDAAALAAGLEQDGRVELQGVHFDTGRATLRPESREALEQVAGLLRAQPELRLNVVGHTDSTGDFQANIQLSQNRAEAVRLALVAQYGIDAARLSAQGVGSALPVADNDTEAGRARNRRVELVRQ